MKDIHWGTLIIGIVLGAVVVPMVISAVRGVGGASKPAPAQ